MTIKLLSRKGTKTPKNKCKKDLEIKKKVLDYIAKEKRNQPATLIINQSG